MNFFDKDDEKILLAIGDGSFAIYGLRAKDLRKSFPDIPPWKISSILKRLRNLKIIKKVAMSYKYHLTDLGRDVIAAGLFCKNIVIAQTLANA